MVSALTTALMLTWAGATGFGQVAARPFVSVMVEGKFAAGFQAEANPIPDVLTSPSRVMIGAVRKDVRLRDGQIVNGFGFNGWQEGNAVFVVMSALVPADAEPLRRASARGATRVQQTRRMPRMLWNPAFSACPSRSPTLIGVRAEDGRLPSWHSSLTGCELMSRTIPSLLAY
jgi:hypothetical protein